MHISRTCCAEAAASSASRFTRSGCSCPTGKTPVPSLAMRRRSATRLLYIVRKASKTAATRIAPRSCGSVRFGLARLPLARLLVDLADRVAERSALAGRLAELLGELTQPVLACEVAAG